MTLTQLLYSKKISMKKVFFIILVTTLFGCNEKSKNNNQTNPNEILAQTPQVLEARQDSKFTYISKRSGSDIVVELYNEAIEKNEKLKQLNEQINQIYQIKNDSLAAYSKFSNTNQTYWTSATNHINQIQDSVLRQSTLEVFKAIEQNYQNKMADYEPKIKEIQRKDVLLSDQLILMKLFISESMMKNYQLNEKPAIKTLETIIKKYDKLIEESKEYTKIEK